MDITRLETSSGRKRSYSEMMSPPPMSTGRAHPEYGFPMASPEVLAKRRMARRRTAHTVKPTAPPPFDFSKGNLKQSVNEAGLWQMTGDRRQSLIKQLPTFLGTSTPQNSDIRIKAVTFGTENWGISADENVRTEFQRTKRSKMSLDEAETVFNQRSHQGTLIWKTGSPSLTQYGDTSDTSRPLSGHTPGIKTENVGGTKGALTKEHGTRDSRREKIVSKTFEDPQRGPHDVAMMSKLATVQLFMSPQEELDTVRGDVAKMPSLFSQFKDIGDISGPHTSSFDKLTSRVQTVRETEKMYAAKNLLIADMPRLVPDTHKQLLTRAKGDVDEAMKLLHQESTSNQPTIAFNTSPHSLTPRLDLQSLGEMSRDTTLLTPPLSPVRKVSSFSFGFDPS